MKYRRKLEIIEAAQYQSNGGKDMFALPTFLINAYSKNIFFNKDGRDYLTTLEGVQLLIDGDFIVRDSLDHYDVYGPKTFAAEFEIMKEG